MKFANFPTDAKIRLLDGPLRVGVSYFQDKDGNLTMRDVSLVDTGGTGMILGRADSCPVCDHLPTKEVITLPVLVSGDTRASTLQLSKEFYQDIKQMLWTMTMIDKQRARARRFKLSRMYYRGR